MVGTSVDYAVWEEFGNRFRPAHPYFIVSWAQAEEYFRQQLIKRMKDLG
jgi:hypothetical protein